MKQTKGKTISRDSRRVYALVLSFALLLTSFMGMSTTAYAVPSITSSFSSASTVSPALDGVSISNVQVFDTANAADWSIQSNLQAGNLAFGDRTAIIGTVASYLVGKEWIRPANDSKTYTSDPLCSFTMTTNAYVYVVHNSDYISPIPAWLNNFVNTGNRMTVSGLPYTIYQKAFAAGTVVQLGWNGNTLPSTYIEVIVPITGTMPTAVPTVTIAPTVSPTSTPIPVTPPPVMYGGDVVENFTTPITFTDGMAFGKDNILTMETAGTPIFDNSSLQFLYARTVVKSDAYIIRTTNPLPSTYIVTVDIGNLSYDLENVADEENGFYMGAIFRAPPQPSTNNWFHHYRKIIYDTDNNSQDAGGTHPIFIGYYDLQPPNGREYFYQGSSNTWTRSWVNASTYVVNKWYTYQVEKTSVNYIVSYSDAITHALIKSVTIPIASVFGISEPDYLLIGDPHVNYYNGSARIANIRIKDTSVTSTPTGTAAPTATATTAPTATTVPTATNTPTPTQLAIPSATTAPTSTPIATNTPTPDQTRIVQLTVSSVTGVPGDTVALSVGISANSNLSAAKFELRYDASLLEFVSANIGSALSGGLSDVINNPETHKVTLVYVNVDPINNSGSILDVQFKIVAGVVEQVINPNFVVIDLLDNDVKNLAYNVNQGSITAIMLGDVSADGRINSADALMALQASTGRRTLTNRQKYAADVTRNGSVNSVDALKILQFSTSRITHF